MHPKLHWRNLALVSVAVLISLLLLISACSSPAPTTPTPAPAPSPTTPAPVAEISEFDVIQTAANTYVTSSPKWNITAKDLYLLLNDGDPGNDPVIVSVRAPDAYAKGHVPGAINVPLADLVKPESLAKLSADKKIVVYCYTGHTGSQATAIFNLLGYDVSNLKFGMTAWTKDTEVAPGRYVEATAGMDYPFVTGTSPK
ncbi:rhodanese-like domain-containing protein [Chloroflexota bacterium]